MGYTEHRSTARVLSILQLAAENKEGYTLSGLAELLNAPKGSIFPILKTLKEYHFLQLDERTGYYQIGPAAFQVGMSYVNRDDSLKLVGEKIDYMVAKCRETVHFAILDKGNVVYLLKKDSPQAIRMISMVGKTLPAYGTGIGKALLMDYSLEELKDIYPNGLVKLTGNTITDFNKLFEELKSFRKDDIAYECEESNKDVQCIAAVIRKNTKIIAALSVAVPVFRCNEKKLEEIREILRIVKKELEEYFAHANFTLY